MLKNFAHTDTQGGRRKDGRATASPELHHFGATSGSGLTGLRLFLRTMTFLWSLGIFPVFILGILVTATISYWRGALQNVQSPDAKRPAQVPAPAFDTKVRLN